MKDQMTDTCTARVIERSAYEAGSCLGCRSQSGSVFVIESDHWVTRFCRECLSNILAQARVLGECEECGHEVVTPLRRKRNV